jgi:hypothetical protein
MRVVSQMLVAFVAGLVLTDGSLHAQQLPPAQSIRTSPDTVTEPASDKSGAAQLDLPVSLDRIREALAQPPPAEPLKGLTQPTFRLRVEERQRFQQLMDTIKFEGGRGPEVAGGRANYELQRLLFPPADNPLVQPYAAFSTGEVVTLAAEAVVEKLITQKVSHVFSDLLRAQTEREAREEVARNLAAFQAAQTAAPPKN